MISTMTPMERRALAARVAINSWLDCGPICKSVQEYFYDEGQVATNEELNCALDAVRAYRACTGDVSAETVAQHCAESPEA